MAGPLLDGMLAGLLMWRFHPCGAASNGRCEIGIVFLPEHRGRLGAAAQGALIDYLWTKTTAYWLEATTESGNLAEQRTRERLGFRPGAACDMLPDGRAYCEYLPQQKLDWGHDSHFADRRGDPSGRVDDDVVTVVPGGLVERAAAGDQPQHRLVDLGSDPRH